jgi:predicted negative regulator of RcsB-dependent stress response
MTIALILLANSVVRVWSADFLYDSIQASVSLADPASTYEPGDDVVIGVRLRNTGAKLVEVWLPDLIRRSLRLEVHVNGRLARERGWEPIHSPMQVQLKPGESRSTLAELSWLFPMSVPAGDYRVLATVTLAPGVEVGAGQVAFTVRSFSREEQEAYEAMIAVVRSGGDGSFTQAALADDYLRVYQNSRFADVVRMEYALALSKLGRRDEAIQAYQAVADSPHAPNWRKRHAAYALAHQLYDKGDLQKAIETLESMNDEEISREARVWRHELETRAQRTETASQAPSRSKVRPPTGGAKGRDRETQGEERAVLSTTSTQPSAEADDHRSARWPPIVVGAALVLLVVLFGLTAIIWLMRKR